MKPVVFLSHSKHDRAIVERIATDLRDARIMVWYDEWEIPPGESFRRQIFEVGIPESDLFFVYLSSASVNSYWVTRELDAAFIHDAEARGGFLGLFVDSDTTRAALSADLRALHSPVLNADTYERALRQLIARAWEGLLRRKTRAAEESAQLRVVALERDLAVRDVQIARLEAGGARDPQNIIAALEMIAFKLPDAAMTLKQFYVPLAKALASGTGGSGVERVIQRQLGLTLGPDLGDQTQYRWNDFLSPLIILELARVVPGGAETQDWFYLTELGGRLAARLAGYDVRGNTPSAPSPASIKPGD